MTDNHALRGRKQTPEAIAARVAGRKKNGYSKKKATPEQKLNYSAGAKKRWEKGDYDDRPKFESHSPETIEKMRETRRQMWADGRYDNKKPATRRRVSKMEESLKPYLEALGYRHNVEGPEQCFINCGDKTRLPDYIDTKGRRVLEFFGDFWHPVEDEPVWIAAYATKSWECTILWEHDLPEWLETHRGLVTEEEHSFALATCRVRSKL